MLRSSKSLSPAARPRMHPDCGSCSCVQTKYQWKISDYRFALCSQSCLFMCWIKILFFHLCLLKRSECLDQFNRVLHSFPLAVCFVRYIRLSINPLFVLFWGASSGPVGEQVAIYNIFKSGMDKMAVIWYWHIKVTERHCWNPPPQAGWESLPLEWHSACKGGSVCLSGLSVFSLWNVLFLVSWSSSYAWLNGSGSSA